MLKIYKNGFTHIFVFLVILQLFDQNPTETKLIKTKLRQNCDIVSKTFVIFQLKKMMIFLYFITKLVYSSQWPNWRIFLPFLMENVSIKKGKKMRQLGYWLEALGWPGCVLVWQGRGGGRSMCDVTYFPYKTVKKCASWVTDYPDIGMCNLPKFSKIFGKIFLLAVKK